MPNVKSRRYTFRYAAILLATFVSFAVAAEPARELSFATAKKDLVRHSMIGVRNTLVFYTFAEKSTVLVLEIDNTSATQPITATLHLFPPDTSAADLAKWVNNQHSDGLFADAPSPSSTIKLPAGTCTITAREKIGQEKQPNREQLIDDWKVKFSVKKHAEEGKFLIPAAEDEAQVFLTPEKK